MYQLRELPKEYIDYNQNNSGSCWLVRPIQCLNLFLSKKLERDIQVSLPYIYLMNLKKTASVVLKYGINGNVNGGGGYEAFRKIIQKQIYQEKEIELKIDIYDKKVSKYLFKRLNLYTRRARIANPREKEMIIKEVENWVDSLYTIKYQKKDFYYSSKYLVNEFIENYLYYHPKWFTRCSSNNCFFITPYERRFDHNRLGVELERIKMNHNRKNPVPDVNIKYFQEIIKDKIIYKNIIENIFMIEQTIDKGDLPLISFLYNREQRYLKKSGFMNRYNRHMAMIESYDKEYFYIRDSRDNIYGEYFFKIPKDKLIFLSNDLTIFKLSKLIK